jgi:DNA-binding CsgD family transcriptional regulator/tetratricopeptide (TPR) repeat protein
MARRVSSPAFIGREAELSWLRAVFGEARGDRASIALVGGDPGIGKTRLVEEFLAWAREQGTPVLAGGCPVSRDGDLPFAPITEALRTLVRERPRDELIEVLGPAVQDLGRLLPELASLGAAPANGNSSSHARLFEAFLGALERLGSVAPPLVLVLEDLQWADPATREMIAFLARNLRTAPVLVVGTFRTDELRPDSALALLLLDLEHSGVADRRDLNGLTMEEATAQFAAITGSDPDGPTLRALHGRAEGNPYLMEELIASRGERDSLPMGIRDRVASRLSMLPAESQEVLRLAATIGRRSSHRLLARTSRFPEMILLAALREAARQQVIAPIADTGAEGYEFRQGIFQEVLYDDMLPGDRLIHHRQVAEALTADPESGWGSAVMVASELARHWRQAGDPDRALSAALKAGALAHEAYAFAEASRQFEVALQLLEAPSAAAPNRGIGFRLPARVAVDRDSLLQRAAEAASLAGDAEAAVRYARALAGSADIQADSHKVCLVSTKLAGYLAEAGDLDGALGEHERAVAAADVVGPSREMIRALGARARTLERAGRLRDALASCQAAIDVAHAIREPEEEAGLLTTLAVLRSRLGDVQGGVEAIERARKLRTNRSLSGVKPRPSRVGTMVRSYAEMAEVLERAGALEASELATHQATDAAQRLGAQGSWGRYLESNEAAGLYHLGKWAEADRAARDLLGGAPGAAVRARALITKARIETGRGEFLDAESHYDAARQELRGRDPVTLAELAAGMAELCLWRRQPSEAVEAVQAGLDAMRSAEDPISRCVLLALGIRAAADLAEQARATKARQDEARAAETAGAWLAELQGVAGDPRWSTELLRTYPALAEAEWARLEGASRPDAWHAVAEAWLRSNEPFAVAYARWREGEALLAGRGARADAMAPLRDAMSIAQALGASPLRVELDVLARRARLDLTETPTLDAPPSPAAALGITPRELEVLLLIADGRTNRQIADALFITEKTAGHHVSNLLGKLGVANRLEAAALAHRAGVGDPGPP